ncbi:PREDICTED: uncharacterized protein LOC108381525 [Rhagoletis zephyria]|uniref:uncharacterized protein LOC108381525 n=1 Tax=Rhagoletis zephyria TaxID=28612 RepID=UPI000811268B|nr:PREDICTED: uncharacterized protein LOC108381525 [Rhagoletis zephyria]
MSFEANLYRQFDLPREQASEAEKQEAQELPSTSKQQKQEAHELPSTSKQRLTTPEPIELSPRVAHTSYPLSLPGKQSQNSCSSQTLFPAPILQSSTPVAHGTAANHISSKRTQRANQPAPNTFAYNLVQQIVQTVGELENTLLEDQQSDFNLRLAYERQTEKLKNMCQSLDNEKARNVRLMELIRGVELSTSTEDDEPDYALSRCGATERWSRTSDVYESISPLLLQQRYDELCNSYKQCRRQLIKKEKLLKLSRCETETAKARYDNLLDEYQIEQKRFEHVCLMYLQLQAKKNFELQRLRDALNSAIECIVSAEKLIDCLDEETITLYMNRNIANLCDENDFFNDHKTDTMETDHIAAFKQNFELFMKSLRLCQRAKKVAETNANQ